MEEQISFRRLKAVIQSKGTSFVEVANKLGISPTVISGISCGKRQPKTDLVAKLCSVLKVYPSEIVVFEGINVNAEYFTDEKREKLPEENNGEVTYKPLFFFLADYLTDWNKSHREQKTEKDLFDQIDPPRRVKGIEPVSGDILAKAREKKFGKDYVAGEYRRSDYSKGLPAITRTKLRSDRPLNLSVIYEICKKLGCTIDFVMSYK